MNKRNARAHRLEASSSTGNRFVVAVTTLVTLVFVLFSASSGHAAPIRALNFTATELSVLSGDPFSVLGLSGPVQQVTGSVVFDQGETPFDVDNFGGFIDAYRTYTSFTVNVGGYGLSGSSNIPFDYILVRNAFAPSTVLDSFQVNSYTDQIIDSNTIISNMTLGSSGANSLLFGTNIPTVTALNSLNLFESFQYRVADNDNNLIAQVEWTNVVWSEGSIIPIPAALPLLLTALTSLGLIGWRRRKAA